MPILDVIKEKLPRYDFTFERNSSTMACRRFKECHIFDKLTELITDVCIQNMI